jgi:hypothetical protein
MGGGLGLAAGAIGAGKKQLTGCAVSKPDPEEPLLVPRLEG